MEVELRGTVEGRRMDADVGVVQNSERKFGGSEMQLLSGTIIREWEETIGNKIIHLNELKQGMARLVKKF